MNSLEAVVGSLHDLFLDGLMETSDEDLHLEELPGVLGGIMEHLFIVNGSGGRPWGYHQVCWP